METERRRFLRAGLATASAGALLGPCRVLAMPGAATQLIGCRSDGQGRHFATLFSSDGRVLFDAPLPARGHGIALSPDGALAAVAARRPGDFLCVIDISARAVRARVQAAPDRHYYGHGVFSADRQHFFATENDFGGGAGRIGIYAVDTWRKVGEIASHGVGPHELALLADRRTLVVANGGIRTHPDMPRAKLNLDAMAPNLSYVDSHDGRLVEQVAPPPHWHQLSLRHLAVTAGDRVAVVAQYESAAADAPPLIALHTRGASLDWQRAPAAIHARMRNYCGSVAFSADGERFAVSSPRGGLVTRWSARGDYLGHHDQADACGLAAARAGFWVSDGGGGLQRIPGAPRQAEFADTRWDNHLAQVAA